MKTSIYIAIDGNIGAGKSSLVRLLKYILKARVLEEPVEENPFLEAFYKDPEKFAFHNQLYFLVARYKQLISITQLSFFYNYYLTDYLFYRDRIFAELTLSKHELNLYYSLYNIVEKEVPIPDYVVYLKADIDTLVKRIKLRNRSFEQDISKDYLLKLNDYYNEFYTKYDKSPLLILDVSNIDFVNNENDQEKVLKEVLSFIEYE